MTFQYEQAYHSMKDRIRSSLPHEFWMGMVKIKNGFCGMMGDLCEWGNFKAQWYKADNFARYQPLPWIGKRSFKRDISTIQRWEAIRKEIPAEGGSAMDIGCNLGFFVLSMAERGFYVIGIDMSPGYRVISEYVQKKAGLSNAAFSSMELTPENISSLPNVDVVIFLSIWHHWIRAYGIERARLMFHILWEKTNHTLFFESGEDKEIKDLDIKVPPSEWIQAELEKVCPGGRVKLLGAFDKGAHKKMRQSRTLYAVKKERK
ncbi:MAG: DUF1698 domain-containing protein [Deltaproteobacteria bacterium]|nr:DUF1698 domain-containing protein [Deltaproteobacteria bacterium]